MSSVTKRLAVNGGTPVRTTSFPSWPVWSSDDIDSVAEAIKSGKWGKIDGSRVRDFENVFARYQDAEFGVAVVNGTVSIRLALLAAGVREGDEVIVPAYTFVATASAVIEANCVPVFVDIEPDTYCMDPEQVRQAITSRTRVVIPVHMAGLAADMDSIMRIAGEHGLVVIEDAAHAHGARYKGRGLGSIGSMGSFSFQSSKNLNAGEGGMITTSDDGFEQICRSLHNCGRLDGHAWYEHFNPGGNYRMGEMQGALLLSQFKNLEKQTVTRDANGRRLDAGLAGIPGIRPMALSENVTRHSRHLYIFRYDAAEFCDVPLDRFVKALNAEGVPCSKGYKPLYLLDLFKRKNFGPYSGATRSQPDMDYGAVSCPVCEKACNEEGVWLTQSTLLGSESDMDDIIEAVRKIGENRSELAG